MVFGQHVLDYHFSLTTDLPLPQDTHWLYPYDHPETRECMRSFYLRFYNDALPRQLILGINPGRFGGGLTGIPFTDPIRLTQLGIENTFPKKPELSSVFIYDMIDSYGGAETFYSQFYITSLIPLGLVRKGVNFNYYDDRELAARVEPFAIKHINAQIEISGKKETAWCLGQGKNYEYVSRLNEKQGWWTKLIPLPHPRWIMQYRSKQKQDFMDAYVRSFTENQT